MKLAKIRCTYKVFCSLLVAKVVLLPEPTKFSCPLKAFVTFLCPYRTNTRDYQSLNSRRIRSHSWEGKKRRPKMCRKCNGFSKKELILKCLTKRRSARNSVLEGKVKGIKRLFDSIGVCECRLFFVNLLNHRLRAKAYGHSALAAKLC